MTHINAKATPTNDTDNSCHIKVVELVKYSFGNNHLPVKHFFPKVSKEILHIFETLKIQES